MKETTSQGLIPESMAERIVLAKARAFDKVVECYESSKNSFFIADILKLAYNKELEEIK